MSSDALFRAQVGLEGLRNAAFNLDTDEEKTALIRLQTFQTMAAVWLSVAAAPAAVIFSNNSPPGDNFTNPGPTNQGQAIGSSGWYYNSVRNNGQVGISVTYPYAGNGSLAFYSPTGSSKAEIAYLPAAVNFGGNYESVGSLGSFSQLESFSYAWYRSGASTVNGHLHPYLRIYLDVDGNLLTPDRGWLTFEEIYHHKVWTAPVNTWVSMSVTSSTYLWSSGPGIGYETNINQTPYAYDATLADWQAYLPNAIIIGFSAGVGSGWIGEFLGAVDQISWTIDGQTSSFNFEVGAGAEIPEPSTWLLTAAGLALLVRRRG